MAGFSVRVACGINVKDKPVGDRPDVVLARNDGHADRSRDVAGGDGQRNAARRHSAVGIGLNAAVYRRRRNDSSALLDLHVCGFVGRVIDHVLDRVHCVLSHSRSGIKDCDNRVCRASDRPDADVLERFGGDRFAVHRSFQPGQNGVRTVRLSGDRVGNRAPGGRDLLREDGGAVHADLERLRAGAGGDKTDRKRRAAVNSHVVQIPGDAEGADVDRPGDGLGVAVAVLDGQLDGVGDACSKILEDVEAVVALLHSAAGHNRRSDPPGLGPCAGGAFVLGINGTPGVGHGAGAVAVQDGDGGRRGAGDP